MVQKARQCEYTLPVTLTPVQLLHCLRLRVDDTDRVQKLKDARSEAAKEIEAYKAKKDEEFKKYESEVSGLSLLIITSIDTSNGSTRPHVSLPHPLASLASLCILRFQRFRALTPTRFTFPPHVPREYFINGPELQQQIFVAILDRRFYQISAISYREGSQGEPG